LRLTPLPKVRRTNPAGCGPASSRGSSPVAAITVVGPFFGSGVGFRVTETLTALARRSPVSSSGGWCGSLPQRCGRRGTPRARGAPLPLTSDPIITAGARGGRGTRTPPGGHGQRFLMTQSISAERPWCLGPSASSASYATSSRISCPLNASARSSGVYIFSATGGPPVSSAICSGV
jgi:hypothetical protein